MADYTADDLLEYNESFAATSKAGALSKEATGVAKGASHVSSSGFRDFFLRSELNRAIVDCGFEFPSEVQHHCIPKAILGTDILCQAKSGMGKTAVFVLAILQQLEAKPEGTKALIICHTHELAYQIASEFQRFSKYVEGVDTAVFYGKIPVESNIKQLQERQPTVVVGTPGRLKDLVERGALKLDRLKFFVLDECDQLLDKMDMRRDVQSIFLKAPKEKQVMMFSATLSGETSETAKKFMHNPWTVLIDDQTKLTLHGLLQYYVKLDEKQKTQKLTDILDNLEFNQVVIFVKSVERANVLNQLLNEVGFPSVVIHSRMKQEERLSRFQDFKSFKHRIVVTTDIFARGIDVERVNIVINYDMPESADTYLHRVGRAGRFGTKGLAVTFSASADDEKILAEIQTRFLVKMEALPEGGVDSSKYMGV